MDALRARSSLRRTVGVVAGACLGLGGVAAAARVHDCIDPATKAVTKSDIPCPTAQGPTAAEAAADAEAKRLALIENGLRHDAKRADDQLLERYPDETAYRRLRAADLEPVTHHIGQATARLSQLIAERKPLDLEAEFYKGKPLPPWLHKKIEESESSFRGLTQNFRDLEHDLAAIVKKYDEPRERLGKLWGGAAPGSMGPLVPVTSVAHSN
jgi:hypothetical protein